MKSLNFKKSKKGIAVVFRFNSKMVSENFIYFNKNNLEKLLRQLNFKIGKAENVVFVVRIMFCQSNSKKEAACTEAIQLKLIIKAKKFQLLSK
jgi:hypothetical protein